MTTAPSWLRPSPARHAPRARLVCFAHAGGGASSFSAWPRALGDDVELVRVQLPTRADHVARRSSTRLGEIVRELSRQVRQLPSLPCAFYGHSLGAIVAFDLARELRGHGVAPARLFVSGRRAPHLPLSHAPLHALDEPALLAYLGEMGGVDARLLDRPGWAATYLPTLRADLEVSDAYVYRPEPPLDVPIHAFRGDHDPSVSLDEIMGWRRHTAADFVFRPLTGRHFFDQHGRDALQRAIAAEMLTLPETVAVGTAPAT